MPAYNKFNHLYQEALRDTAAMRTQRIQANRQFSQNAPAHLAGLRVHPGLLTLPGPHGSGNTVPGLAQPPITDRRHELAIFTHYLGVPGSQCQRRASGKKCVFKDEILYFGTKAGTNLRLFDRCTSCIWANDGSPCGSVSLQPGGPALSGPTVAHHGVLSSTAAALSNAQVTSTPAAPTNEMGQLLLEGPSDTDQPRYNTRRAQPTGTYRLQHEREFSEDLSVGSGESVHTPVAGAVVRHDPSYGASGPSQTTLSRRPLPRSQREESDDEFFDAVGTPMEAARRILAPPHNPDQGFNDNQHGVPAHLRTFGIREFDTVTAQPSDLATFTRRQTRVNRREFERRLGLVPGHDAMSDFLPGDTEEWVEDTDAFGVGSEVEERLRDINSRRLALARAVRVGPEQAQKELDEELAKFLKENGSEAQEERRKAWDKYYGTKRKRDGDDDDEGQGRLPPVPQRGLIGNRTVR